MLEGGITVRLEYFQYLLMLKEAGSINKSAALLHTSPQNVSRVLKALEDELDVVLVNRSLTGIEFTEAGLGAVEMGTQFLDLLAAYQLQYHKNSQIMGELNIFATKIQSTLFLSDIVTKFAKLYPKIKLNYVENDFLICLNKVRSFSNSVGLLPILESETTEKQWDNMILQKISSDRIAIITERNSQMGKQKEVSYESLKGKRFVIHARNDYEDGFWGNIIDKYIMEYEDIFIASNSYLFFNKIWEDGYIGLGCEKTSTLSETLQKEEARTKISIIPINDFQSLFHNYLVVPKELSENQCVACLYHFLCEVSKV